MLGLKNEARSTSISHHVAPGAVGAVIGGAQRPREAHGVIAEVLAAPLLPSAPEVARDAAGGAGRRDGQASLPAATPNLTASSTFCDTFKCAWFHIPVIGGEDALT